MITASNKIESTDEAVSTTRKVASLAHDAIEGAADKAEPIEQQIRERADQAGEQLELTQAAAAEQVGQSMKNIETFVKERPIAAAGIAFAAGALAALLLKR